MMSITEVIDYFRYRQWMLYDWGPGPTRFAPKNYAETRDSISWAWAYAPGFKGHFTRQQVFANLRYGVGNVLASLKDAERIAIAEECMRKLDASERYFQERESKPAHQALFDAGELFRSLRRPKDQHLNLDGRDSADDTVDS
jgi:hypothetical protein